MFYTFACTALRPKIKCNKNEKCIEFDSVQLGDGRNAWKVLLTTVQTSFDFKSTRNSAARSAAQYSMSFTPNKLGWNVDIVESRTFASQIVNS